VAFPNPARGSTLRLRLRLEAPADSVEARLYSASYSLVLQREAGPWAPGWGQLELPLPPGLARGVYFVVLRARRERVQSPVQRLIVYYGGV
jgi:hypothetical protein